MRYENITLTPEMARSFLAVNTKGQRTINASWVETLASDITSGRWNPNLPNNALVIDESGNMIDGQHRCLAVIKANMPIKTIVAFGASNDVFELLDSNRSRKVTDFLGKHRTVIASIIKFAVCIECGSSFMAATSGRLPGSASRKSLGPSAINRDRLPSRTQLLEYYHDNESYINDLAVLTRSVYGTQDLKLATAKAWGCSFWLIDMISNGNTDKRDAFCDELRSNYTDPSVQKCITTLMKMKNNVVQKKTRYNLSEWMAVILTAYDNYGTGHAFAPRDIKKAIDVWQKKIDAVRAINESTGDYHATN